METVLNNKSLTFKHISHAASEIVEYINGRRLGTIRSLKTRWKKFNDCCEGGISPNSLYTIAGISGSGKSSFVNSVETDLFDLNPKVDFVVLSFSFEMLSSKQVGRKLSYKLKKTTSELYTVKTPLSEGDFKKVEDEAKKIKDYPIFYVDTPGTVPEIRNTILKFMETYVKDKWLVITFDHALLAKSEGSEKERETLVSLQRMFIEIKKIDKTSIIQVSQMNREIEEKDRILNPSLHFPQRRDLSSSDALFQASDFVIVIHRPELLGIKSYGIHNWPVEHMIYLHCIKNRDGEQKILSFTNNLAFNSIEEATQQI